MLIIHYEKTAIGYQSEYHGTLEITDFPFNLYSQLYYTVMGCRNQEDIIIEHIVITDNKGVPLKRNTGKLFDHIVEYVELLELLKSKKYAKETLLERIKQSERFLKEVEERVKINQTVIEESPKKIVLIDESIQKYEKQLKEYATKGIDFPI